MYSYSLAARAPRGGVRQWVKPNVTLPLIAFVLFGNAFRGWITSYPLHSFNLFHTLRNSGLAGKWTRRFPQNIAKQLLEACNHTLQYFNDRAWKFVENDEYA
jgi:hypothetical protein